MSVQQLTFFQNNLSGGMLGTASSYGGSQPNTKNKAGDASPAQNLSEVERDKALKRVAKHNEEFLSKAVVLIRKSLEYGQLAIREFTGEDIRRYLEGYGITPSHSNAYGALISCLLKRKLIVPTGEYRAMKAPNSHARKTPVYRVSSTLQQPQGGSESN